ncbi:MAG: hypothetical protein IKH88_18305 [Prevotella sp.]|nr:hypothetical protein [Prevotella sp.]
MKKILSMLLLLTVALDGMAQEVKEFKVGPYDVRFIDETEYNFQPRKDISREEILEILYDDFKIKKDTVVKWKEETEPLKTAWMLNASFSMPRFVANGTSNVFGVDGAWKKAIGETTWLNIGLSLALSTGKYVAPWKNKPGWEEDATYNESIFEVGVPVSVEWTRLDRKKAALYFGVGIVPTFYSGAKGKEVEDENKKVTYTDESRSGLFVAPRLDFGGYIPAGKQLVRVGLFGQYDINFSTEGGDIFADRIGHFFVGGNVGFVF